MPISTDQKLDYLWKKLAYGLTKTDTNANKRAINESIASPLLLRGENVWAQSSDIPGTMPASSAGVVTVYPTTSPDETTADSSATTNRTWLTGLTDWIPPEYGSTYQVKVYIHDAGDAGDAAADGTQIFAAGSGNDDEWFFDYQSGILHFIGTNLPSGISGKVIYISGARYTGIRGVSTPGAAATFTSLNVTGISTFGGDVDINADVDISDDLTVNGNLSVVGLSTFAGNIDINANIDVDGQTDLDDLVVAGVSTFSAAVDINSTLDVDGQTDLDDLVVAGVSTFTGNIDANGTLDVDGETQLDDLVVSGVSTFTGNIDANGNIDVDGHTELDELTVSAASTFGGLVDINAGAQANTFKVEDLTDNRIVIAGVGGELEDDAKLTFDGSTLGVGTNLSVTGVSTFSGNVDISSSGNLTVAGNLTVNGTETILNVNTLEVEDINIGIASADPKLSNAALDGAGFTIHGAAGDKTLTWSNANSRMEFNTNLSATNLDSGNLTLSGTLDVDGQTDLDDLVVSGVSTFTGAIDANGTLDVDGQTELDDLVVSGVSTLTGNVSFGSSAFFGDGDTINMGDGDDLQIFHSGVTGNIKNTTGTLILQSSTVRIQDGGSSQTAFSAADGIAKLYFENSEKLTTNAQGIDVTGHTETDTLNVSGLSTFTGAIDANGTLDVDGQTDLDDLVVAGVSTFSAAVDINSTLDVDGDTQLDDLNVAGVSTFSAAVDINSTLDVDGQTDLDDLVVSGVSTFTGAIDANGTLDVDGETQLDDLVVSGVSTFTGAIDANGTLDVDGHTELDTLNVSVATTSASLTLANAGVAVTAILDEDGLTSDRADALATQQSIKAYVDSQVTAQDLDFEGDSGTGAVDLDSQTFTIAGTANEIETVGSGITLTIGLPDRVTIGQDLTVSRHLSITGVSTFTGAIDANGTLDVDGQTDLDDLVVAGVSTFSSAVDINSTLDVDGQTDLDDLVVAGVSTFSAAVDIDSTLDVDGTATFDDINVSSAATITTATITNTIFGSGTAITSVDTDISSVSGSDDTLASAKAIKTYVDSQVTAQDLDFIADSGGALSIDLDSETFQVAGTPNEIITVGAGNSVTVGLNTDVTIARDLDVTRNLDVDGQTDLDDLVVAGVSTFSSAVDIDSTLDVDGETQLDDLVVSGVSTFTGAIDANGTLDVDGQTDLDDLIVAGVSTFSAAVDVNSTLDVDGQTDLDDLVVAGVSTFSALVDINAGGQANTFKVEDLTNNRIVIAGDGGELEDDANLTFNGSILTVGTAATFTSGDVHVSDSLFVGGLEITGGSTIGTDVTTRNLSVSGFSTFSGPIDANGTLDVDGQTDLDDLVVSGVSTFNGNVDLSGNITSNVTIVSTDAGSSAAPELKLYRNSASPADADYLGQIKFAGESDTGAERNYAKITGKIKDASNGTEDGIIEVAHIKDGSQNISARWNSETLQLINDTQISVAGTATFSGPIDANGTLDVDGTATFDDVQVGSAITAAIFVKNGGASTEFLKADGSTDSNTYLTSETQTLNDVLTLGNRSGIGISVGVVTATALHTGNEGSAIRITSDTISGPASLIIDPSAVGDNTGAVRIKGDLFVDGTEFIVNSTTIDLADHRVGIATTVGTNALLDGGGIGIGSTGILKTILWNNASSSLKSSENWDIASGKTFKINGTDVLSATTLGSNVVNSSLTTVGTLIQVNVSGASTLNGPVTIGNTMSFGDDDRLRFGDDNDLQIFHNGSNSIIQDSGTGDLRIAGSKIDIRNAADTEQLASFTEDGAVELFFDDAKKFETHPGGAIVTGILTATSFSGSGADLTNLPASTIGINTVTTNSAQLVPFALGYGSTTGLGATDVYVFNPSTNRMGIGTTNPQFSLDVVGDINSSTAIKVNGTSVLDEAIAFAIALG